MLTGNLFQVKFDIVIMPEEGKRRKTVRDCCNYNLESEPVHFVSNFHYDSITIYRATPFTV